MKFGLVHPTRSLNDGGNILDGQSTDRTADIYSQFGSYFGQFGYHKLSDAYTTAIIDKSDEQNGDYRQIDFVKDKVLIEVQFGKDAFMFYDMAKLQYFFNENKADVGIEILPYHALQKQLLNGVSDDDQLVYHIEQLKRHFPVVPVKLIFVDVDA
ncbi:MAG: BglII/BstYI family type II restriction endonuclease [Caldilineaceae bacterium]